MAARPFNIGQIQPGTAPKTIVMQYASGQTFVTGALLTLTSGELVECGADPVAVVGVAGASYNTNYGQDAANSPVVVTGLEVVVPVLIADDVNVFTCRGVNGATDPVTPAVADIGVGYGVVKTSDGSWALDQADTTHDVVVVTDIDVARLCFYVKFVAAVRTFG
jgi:hypothetical protein